ncbi:MAG: hypothetical protein ACRDKE_03255 [Solirubrobacterales bacterium]
MIARLRERPGKLLPMLLFATAAAFAWWAFLMLFGTAEIIAKDRNALKTTETLDDVSYWLAMAGLLVVPVATLVWSRKIASRGWSTAAGIGTAFVVYVLAAVPMFLLWVLMHKFLTGEPWNL